MKQQALHLQAENGRQGGLTQGDRKHQYLTHVNMRLNTSSHLFYMLPFQYMNDSFQTRSQDVLLIRAYSCAHVG